MNRLGRAVIPPLVAAVVGVGVWAASVAAFHVPRYVLPGPGVVAGAVWERPGTYAGATVLTAAESLGGFFAAVAVGSAAGLVFAVSPLLRSAMYPYAIFLQTVPVVAVAPLIILWMGYGPQAVVVVSAVVGLFPVVANVTAGLVDVDPRLAEVFALYRAGRWRTLWRLRVPSAVPALVVGAKTSAGLSVIGAIVGEFFTGYGSGPRGLGYLIRASADQTKTADLFAAVLLSTLLGVALFAGIAAAADRLVKGRYDLR
ncbi:MAG: ABC transporter permease subunit [Planctomycetota bacterium]